VRASAALLLADHAGPEAIKSLTALTDDAVPEVRSCVAHSIGFAQRTELANLLGRLLADKDPNVRRATAMSLLSFSSTNEAVAEVFQANIENDEFKPLFLNALAREKPAAHLDALAKAIDEKANPKNWWGGEIPAFTSWKILFKYVQTQPVDNVRSGKLNRYLDAIEKVGNYSSSEPRDIYAFYLQRGMTERAKNYREAANKSASYDLDYYFKAAEKNPSLYIRE
jgi:HEAT repeat protein